MKVENMAKLEALFAQTSPSERISSWGGGAETRCERSEQKGPKREVQGIAPKEIFHDYALKSSLSRI